MKVIIVDDEPQSHRTLKAMLHQLGGDIEITGQAYDVASGKNLIETMQPDVVFLDIEMPDGTGFDLLRQIGRPNFITIFVSGFNQYGLDAIQIGALDFVTKPISPLDLSRAVRKAEKRLQEKAELQRYDLLREALASIKAKQLPARIGIPNLEGIIYRPLKDIIRMEAQKNYTDIYTQTNAGTVRDTVSTNLKVYEKYCGPDSSFMRVHRSHIVNLDFVHRFVRTDGHHLEMVNGDLVAVASGKRDGVLGRL